MRLPSAHIKSIVGAAKIGSSPARAGGKRGAGRIRVNVTAGMRRLASPAAPLETVSLIDISMFGLGFRYDSLLIVGEKLFIQFTPERAEPRAVSFVVRRCKLAADGRYLVGGDFEQLLPVERSLNEAERIRAAILS